MHPSTFIAALCSGMPLTAPPRSRRTRTRSRIQLEARSQRSIPSQANFIMADVKKPVVPLIAAMKQRDVQVGRLTPALPSYMRVKIGEKMEMEAFVSAFREVAT
jgi:histidinol-phosphate/aromatic aminotransferase/cobyric acid decarboxylase-like protein